MSLTVEDGTIVAEADSYVSVADYRAFAAKYAVTLPVADGDCEAQLRKAADYLMQYEDRFVGDRADEEQVLSWPRANATINGFEIEDDVIPKQLKNAQMQAALEINAGSTLLPSSDGKQVKRFKVDVIEKEYMTAQDSGGTSGVPSFASVNVWLDQLLEAGGVLGVVRV